MNTIGDQVAGIRRVRSMTQEDLAERAGISVGTVSKLERNERTSARMATLAKIARVLGVPTSTLLAGDASTAAARREPTYSPLALLSIRRALTPVTALDGQVLSDQVDAGAPTIVRARESLDAADRAYHSNDFGTVLAAAPGLLAETRTLVSTTTGDERLVAHGLASAAYQLAGRLLIQLRSHDLAYVAISAARAEADQSGDLPRRAAAVWPMCWLLLRQARLSEAEALAVGTSDQVEPRLSQASVRDVEAWSWLLLEAAAAMARDGRDQDAGQMLDLAAAAAARIDTAGGAGIGTAKVNMARVEAAAISGNPQKVLTLTSQMSPGRAVAASCWQRHRLDVAWAHAELGHWPDSTAVLIDLRDRAPAWLRHQRYARDIVSTIAKGRRRAMSTELAGLAALVGAGT